ncbi:MAG: proline--tRNA ligase [Acidobacteria bacterium]|nr:proline--tRNA ligase [Acidobacteriota bacterium]
MRWSRFYLFTTREVPKDAEVTSHQLMVRAGMIRRVAAGIYSYLPLGWRSLSKLMAIVRRELDVAGCVELTMPAIQPAELWQESGRWEQYGKELLRMEDRHGREFCFGPTHEEVITEIVRKDVTSYRQLPVNLYQIQVKFRDEVRPRFGLMRGREFLMKDAYSFHATPESLEEAYAALGKAYERIFRACGLDFIKVEADSGAIGGSASHEFMVVADTGESLVLRCAGCDYAANQEKAGTSGLAKSPAEDSAADDLAEGVRLEETPGKTTVEEVAAFLGVAPQRIVKTIIYRTEAGPVAVLVRGDREVNAIKLKNLLDVQELELADEALVEAVSGAPVGFAGPIGLEGVRIVADRSVEGVTNFTCGANRADAHWVGANFGKDVHLDEFHDLMLVADGDRCPNCDQNLVISHGIEVGHIFKLGTKYSEPMGCNYLDDRGQSHPMLMGCYGLGIGRTVAAAIEQNHDDKGIIWPLPLAPFEALVVPLNMNDQEVVQAAGKIYEELVEKRVDVLFDDRQERPGVKFNDADLIGIPIRLVVGSKSLANGEVEVSLRRDGEKQLVPLANAVEAMLDAILAESPA